MLLRKIFRTELLALCLLFAGCGTGAFEKLGDVADHCEFEWGEAGRLELNLQCD